MVLRDEYLYKAFEAAAIEQKRDELKEKGYRVSCDKGFDLLAQKDEQLKAFEFKFRGDNRNSDTVLEFMERAEQKGAEPIVIYMSAPGRTSIEFDDLGEIVYEYLSNHFPEELDALSTHTRLEEVYIERIGAINLMEKNIFLKADASVCVTLQYGSDRENEGEEEDYMTFPMEFEAEFSWERSLVNLEYQINTESFYE